MSKIHYLFAVPMSGSNVMTNALWIIFVSSATIFSTLVTQTIRENNQGPELSPWGLPCYKSHPSSYLKYSFTCLPSMNKLQRGFLWWTAVWTPCRISLVQYHSLEVFRNNRKSVDTSHIYFAFLIQLVQGESLRHFISFVFLFFFSLKIQNMP